MAKPQSIKENFEAFKARAKARGYDLLHWLDGPTRDFASVIYHTFDNFAKHGPREAAALSYYALFSLFPLLLLIVVGIGNIIGPSATAAQIQDFLTLFLPGQTATEISRTIERFVQEGSFASLFAIISLLWSGLGLFSNLEGALSRTFGDVSQRDFIMRRLVGAIMIIALGALLVANIVTSLVFSFLDLLFLNQSNIWISIGAVFIPFGFSMGLFAMLYRFIPRKKIGWDAIWPAALIGGALWEAAKIGFGYYLDAATNLSVVYGSITTVIIFMLWAYVTFIIILLCGEFCNGLAKWLEKRRAGKTPQEFLFAGDYYEQQLTLDAPPPRESPIG